MDFVGYRLLDAHDSLHRDFAGSHICLLRYVYGYVPVYVYRTTVCVCFFLHLPAFTVRLLRLQLILILRLFVYTVYPVHTRLRAVYGCVVSHRVFRVPVWIPVTRLFGFVRAPVCCVSRFTARCVAAFVYCTGCRLLRLRFTRTRLRTFYRLYRSARLILPRVHLLIARSTRLHVPFTFILPYTDWFLRLFRWVYGCLWFGYALHFTRLLFPRFATLPPHIFCGYTRTRLR